MAGLGVSQLHKKKFPVASSYYLSSYESPPFITNNQIFSLSIHHIYRVFSKNLNLNYINFLKRFMYTEPFYWLYRILANYFTKNMGAITHSMGAITHSLPYKTFLEAVLSSSYVDYKTILARNSASRKVNLPECRV